MKVIRLLLILLHYLYRGIQCDKAFDFVHEEAFEAQHEMAILGVELKTHTQTITNVQFRSNFLNMSQKLCF